jgi:hypothetical protein
MVFGRYANLRRIERLDPAGVDIRPNGR